MCRRHLPAKHTHEVPTGDQQPEYPMKPLFPILSTALLLASCTGTADQVQETEAAKDSTATPTATAWVGSYADTLPCADCPGIFTRQKMLQKWCL